MSGYARVQIPTAAIATLLTADAGRTKKLRACEASKFTDTCGEDHVSDLKLFKLRDEGVEEIEGKSVAVEKSLQNLIEKHLEELLGIKFLASEYSTGKMHGGRIDTLGIDENRCPAIIEYKRAINENVINQGLYYLNWLVDHKGEFELLAWKQLGKGSSEQIEWGNPRLVCIAGDFTRYDEHAVQQMNRNIELVRYRKYGKDLLLFELVNATTAETPEVEPGKARQAKGTAKGVAARLAQSDAGLRDLFESLKSFLMALGDDVQKKNLKFYFAFKRLKNFACVEIHPQTHRLVVFVKVDPKGVSLKDGFTRDVSEIGHYGTGNLEITIRSMEDFERAKPLIVQSYESS